MTKDAKYHTQKTGSQIEPVFIAKDPVMQDLYDKINKIAKSDTTVLITGESGTGKEVVSRLIHQKSKRRGKSFVALNAGAIPKDIVESELFGHEKGAFTGAVEKKKGCFELADNGTLFLDEIAEMALDIQVKLLRAVEYNTFRRLGGSEEIKTDVRIIAATNKNLSKAVAEGEFRKDLFYRMSVIELHIPALRERKGDIPHLAKYFLNEFADKHNVSRQEFSQNSMDQLVDYNWPGNVRELRNVIERCVIMCSDGIIEPEFLPQHIISSEVIKEEGNETNIAVSNGGPLHTNGHGKEVNLPIGVTLEEAEKILINRTLSSVNNNKSEAARILGFSRQTLHNKLEKYGS